MKIVQNMFMVNQLYVYIELECKVFCIKAQNEMM